MNARLVLQRVLVLALLMMLILVACTSGTAPVQTSIPTIPSTRLPSATMTSSTTPIVAVSPTPLASSATQTLSFSEARETEVSGLLAPKKSICPVGEVDLELSVDTGWIISGPESVTIQFVITNNGTETEVSEKADGPVIDIVVPSGYSDRLAQTGTPPPVVKRWSDLQPRDQIPHRLELKPGESHRIQMVYTSQIYAGSETVKGILWRNTQYFPCTISFTVGPIIR